MHTTRSSAPRRSRPSGATTRLDPDQLGTILSVWAHPDDETYLAAGVMSSARVAGQRVVCVSATAGEHGTDDADRWPPERLGSVRRWEAAAAMAVLQVAEHHILGLPDGELADHDRQGVASVRALIAEVDPDTILTFGPDGMTYHPDHISVHRWVTHAWSASGCSARLLYATTTDGHLERHRARYEEWDMYMTDQRPTGVSELDLAVHVRLDGPALDRKLTALRAMATQTSGLLDAIGLDDYVELVRNEWFIEMAPFSPGSA